MFKKVHIRLTILFTAVCMLIISIMSATYLYLNYNSIYNNAFSSFSKDIVIFSSSFSSSSVLSHEWLHSMQKNYNYRYLIYDNDKPIQFTQNNATAEELELIDDICSTYSDDINQLKYSGIPQNKIYRLGKNADKKYVGVISIPGEYGNTIIYTINLLPKEKQQVRKLFISFIFIVLLACAALYVFAYFFTRRLLKPIKESQEKQELIIAAASHEIRNPVNTIISALEAADKSDEEQRKSFSDIAQQEGHRLKTLTEDLLTIARTKTGSFNFETSPEELDTIVLDCYEAFLAPAQDKSISLKISIPDETVPKAMINPTRIKQVISILLNNAISYTPEKGVIRLSYSLSYQHHIISVSDSGPGISDKDKEHLFEYFYRADHSREDRSHFGLGLAIAKEIVELHNGTIRVMNGQKQGTEFIVELPIEHK